MKTIACLVLGWLALAPIGIAYGQSQRDDHAGKNQKPSDVNAKPPANQKAPDLDFAVDEGRESPGLNRASGQRVWLYWTLGTAAVVGGGIWYFRIEPVKSTVAPIKTTQVFSDG